MFLVWRQWFWFLFTAYSFMLATIWWYFLPLWSHALLFLEKCHEIFHIVSYCNCNSHSHMLGNSLYEMLLFFLVHFGAYSCNINERSNCSDHFTLSENGYIWMNDSPLKKYTQECENLFSVNKKFDQNKFSVFNPRVSDKTSRVVDY